MNGMAQAIARCFQYPTEHNLRELDQILRPRIYAILASVYRRSPEHVQDAYQSAFIKYLALFRKGPPNPAINYEGYFVAIAKNCLLDELRRESRHVPLDGLAEELLAQHGGAEEVEAGVTLFQAMSRLDRRCQFLLEAHYINAMSDWEVAEHLGVEATSVPALVSRCKQRLVSCIGK